jgi:NAD(P)-dependent dehydrogenase (short-subunit alcohol dehydrogenase family)
VSPAPVALVTGSSRGIGLHVARALAEAGHRVVLVARDAARLEAARAELGALGAASTTVAVDLREQGSVEIVLRAARQAFGEPDVLVNNAGTAPTARLQATTDAMLAETLQLHVQVPLRLARAVLPGMLQRGAGCIVQIASTAGLRAFPFTAAYSAAKHAMVGLTRAMALELASTGVRAYAVCPGFVDTDITRQAAAAIAARGRTTPAEALGAMAAQNAIGRMHAPDEVAAAVAWLARERPAGCVYDLDHDPPLFRDQVP